MERLHAGAILDPGLSYLSNQRARERRGWERLVERDLVHLRLDIEAGGAVRFRHLKQLGKARDARAVERPLLREVARVVAARPQAADIVALQLGKGQLGDRGGAR